MNRSGVASKQDRLIINYINFLFKSFHFCSKLIIIFQLRFYSVIKQLFFLTIAKIIFWLSIPTEPNYWPQKKQNHFYFLIFIFLIISLKGIIRKINIFFTANKKNIPSVNKTIIPNIFLQLFVLLFFVRFFFQHVSNVILI